MKKHAQALPGQDPLAGMMDSMGGDPSGLGATPPMDVNAPSVPEAPPQPPVQVYKGLSSPEDIMTDFNIQEKLKDQYSDEDLAHQIWQLYGGDSIGLNALPGKTGEWPKEEPSVSDEKLTENQHKITESPENRYKRLAQGFNIKDIFQDEADIQRLITYTVSTMQKASKQPQAQNVSWYRYARKNL
jgi:hypothetical protein